MIRLGNLHISNVGPFESEEFDFDVKEEHPDIHIFTGANGTGKTTILHALANVFNFSSIRKHHVANKNANKFNKRFKFFWRMEDATDRPYIKESKIQVKEFFRSFCSISLCAKKSNTILEKATAFALNDQNLNFYFGDEIVLDENFDLEKSGIPKRNNEITYYRNTIKETYLPTVSEFKFAAFGYSGYRFIKSNTIKSIEDFNDNPFNNALEFDKKTDENNNISNWIINRYAKAAIEEVHGNKVLAKKSITALGRLMDSIETLTDGEFTFAIKTNPWQVVTKYHGNEIEFDVLPDGLRSILSWMGDLLMRLDQIPWEDKTIPVNEQDIILFLDEIEVHLHPKWQYRILPLTERIFPNAQIFITTHSPFILNSIDNAKIYQLETEEGVSKLKKVSLSNTGDSYQYIYEEILGVTKRFGVETEKDIKRFNEIDSEIVQGNFERETEFKEVIERLADEGEEVIPI